MRVVLACGLAVLLCGLAACDGEEATPFAQAAAMAVREEAIAAGALTRTGPSMPNSNQEAVPVKKEADEEGLKPEQFSKIPFFVFKDGATNEKDADSQQKCQDVCLGRTTCKSYSWSRKQKDCLTSKHKLSFNGEYTFYTRRVYAGEKGSGDALMGRYRAFAGLVFQSKDFTRYEEKTVDECKKFCDTAVDGHGRKCNGFSYNEDKEVCMLSPFGLQYETNYDYYERNPEPIEIQVETTDPVTGDITITKKEKPVPVDVKVESAVKPFNETPEYKAQLTMQEAAAKQGAKEHSHKALMKKEVKHEKKELKTEEVSLQKEEKQEEVAQTKSKSPKATLERMKREKEREEAQEEETQKQYVLLLQKEKEQAAKKAMEIQRAKDLQEEKEQAELAAELNVKTEKKRIRMEEAAHVERQHKKVSVIVRAGRALAVNERKNKEKAFNAEENNAKEKLVKVDVKRTLANRHAKHKAEFDQFVADSTERNMKVRHTDKAAAVAMEQSKKAQTEELSRSQEGLKAVRALTHGLGLEIEKLKAQADGYQHEINQDAKEGKASPKAEVKLAYTMDNIKTEAQREAHRKRDIMKKEREILEQMDALKELDGQMSKMGIGRRRRAVADATHVSASDPAKVNMAMPTAKLPAESSSVGGRRRRSKARLTEEYMKDIATGGETGETMVPGVPAANRDQDEGDNR